jgi:tetratricopeptide (TPR) repeat protein
VGLAQTDDNYDADALYNKGLGLANLGKYDEAIKYFDRALDIDPNNIGALTNKGASLIYLGRPQEASSYFDRALDIDA